MGGALSELYQRLVIDHNRAPRNRRAVPGCTGHAHGHSPLCGDDLELRIRLENHRIADLGFDGEACAVATASASLLTEACRGLSCTEALDLFRAMIGLVEGGEAGARARVEAVNPDLALLGSAVHAFPGRHKCARLPWAALASLLAAQSGGPAIGPDPDLRISIGQGPGSDGAEPAVTEAS